MVGSIPGSLKQPFPPYEGSPQQEQPLPRPSLALSPQPPLLGFWPPKIKQLWPLSVPSKNNSSGGWFTFTIPKKSCEDILTCRSAPEEARTPSGSTPTKLSIGLIFIKRYQNFKTKLVRLPSQHFLVAFGVQLLSSGIIGKFSGFFVCFSMFQCTFTDCHDARMHFLIRKRLTTTQVFHPSNTSAQPSYAISHVPARLQPQLARISWCQANLKATF